MSPRRIITIFGPMLGLGVVVGLVGGTCLCWPMTMPAATDFVSRSLADSYGVALSAKGRTEISLLPLPRLGFRDVRLTAGDRDGPVLAEGGRLSIQLDIGALLRGRAELVSLVLDGATVTLPEGADDTRWRGPIERLSTRLAADGSAHPRRLTLSRLTLHGRDMRDGRPDTVRDVDIVLAWPFWTDRLEVSGGLTWKGETVRLEASGLAPAELSRGGASPFKVGATWGNGSLSAEGSAELKEQPKFSGVAIMQTGSLPDALAWLGADMALAPLVEDFAIEARFESQGAGLQIPSMRIKTGGTVLDGAGSLELSGRRPSIRATLDADALNLGPLLGGALRIAGLDGDSDGWARRSLALAPLTGGDLDLRLSGARARLGPVVLGDVAASVMVRADNIQATLNRAGLEGGTLKGHLQLTGAHEASDGGTDMRAQGTFEGLDLAALLVDFGQTGWIVGPARGGFVLEARGRDADSLVRGLSGRATLGVGGGTLAGLDLGDVANRNGAVAQAALSRRSGRTPFEQANVALSFRDGVGEIAEGRLSGRSLDASLRGRVSLPDRSLTARAELLPRSNAAEVAKAPVTLFEIAGPWDSVAVRGPERREGVIADPLRLPAGAASVLPAQARAYAP